MLAEIVAVARQSVEVKVLELRDEDRESGLALTLVQCISRGQHMDFTIQKAVELGVSRIVPVISEHSNVKLSAERLPGKLRHWQQVIISACEQCGRNRLPQLDTALPLAEWLDSDPNDCRLILHPGSGQGLATMATPTRGVSLLAGPEGGLSDAEVEQARQHGCTAVALGPRILRTETAPIAALSIIQYRWGDLSPGN